MKTYIKDYFCIDCKGKFVPRSNSSKRCVECQSIAKKELKRLAKIKYRATGKGKKNAVAYSKKWQSENRDKCIQHKKDTYNRHKESIRVKQNDYRKNNSEKVNEQQRIYYASLTPEQREKRNAYNREYHKLNPQYSKRSKMIRRSREKDLCAPPPAKEILKRKQLFIGCCFCGCDDNSTIEHLIPIAKGGDNDILNLFWSCLSCNCSKQDKEWKLWYRNKKFYAPEREIEIEIYSRLKLITVRKV